MAYVPFEGPILNLTGRPIRGVIINLLKLYIFSAESLMMHEREQQHNLQGQYLMDSYTFLATLLNCMNFLD